MSKVFNVTGDCKPKLHYMVNIDKRLQVIKAMVDAGQYITINRARQYGKTTTLMTLEQYLTPNYCVLNMDFQSAMSSATYRDEASFSKAFAKAFAALLDGMGNPAEVQSAMEDMLNSARSDFELVDLFRYLSRICRASDRPIVLLIDEVDSASNNQVFLDFLSQIRGAYIKRDRVPTFQSVILAGVHYIRNLQLKIRPAAEHKHNSPWNIATSLDIDMSFSPADIATMLTDYESDHSTGMDIEAMSQMLYDYTSGYPVLVSQLCKLIDEQVSKLPDYPTLTAAWTKNGMLQALKLLNRLHLPLFESLINKLEENDNLRQLLYRVLFTGERIPTSVYDATISEALMYGFLKSENDTIVIANRLFQSTLYDWFLAQEYHAEIAKVGSMIKPRYIRDGKLNMELVLEKFVESFHDIYGAQTERLIEDDGRKLFLLYLRPIINGTGNYYIEAQTRDLTRTDVIVDYLGEQFVIEMKIWRGAEYNARGEQQLAEYLDYYHISKGYMLSFNFNQNKQVGTKTIQLGDKTIFEAVV